MSTNDDWNNQAQNQVIVAGPGGGVFVYDPSPGLGNLIASITDSAADPYGNATLSGVTGYSQSGGVFYAASLGPSLGGASAFTIWTASSAAGPYTNQGGLAADSSGNMVVGANANLTLSTVAGSLLGRKDSAGLLGYLPIVQVDTGTNTNANSGGALRLSAIYTIPAGDLQAGTRYVIEMPFNATMEGNTLELGLSVDGSASFTVNNTISGGIVGAGSSINGVIRVGLMCTATGVSGTITAWTDGSVNATSAATTFANSGGLAGNIATGVTLDTTASHTIRVNSLWGASNASQTVSGRTSICTREGP